MQAFRNGNAEILLLWLLCFGDCLSSAIHCMGHNIQSLAACARVRTGIGGRKRLKLGSDGTPIGNGIRRIEWSRDR